MNHNNDAGMMSTGAKVGEEVRRNAAKIDPVPMTGDEKNSSSSSFFARDTLVTSDPSEVSASPPSDSETPPSALEP